MPSLNLKTTWHKRKEQQKLRREYGIENANTIVVERKNPLTNSLRVLLQFAKQLVQVLASILVVALATIGLATLVYPNTRTAFLANMQEAFAVLQNFIGITF